MGSYLLMPQEDGEGPGAARRPARSPAAADPLVYHVELWNPAKSAVERVLAATADAVIGYAAYYAATREFPDRYITLRHESRIVSRWNGPVQ